MPPRADRLPPHPGRTPAQRRPHDVLPRWVLERAYEALSAMAARRGLDGDSEAADFIARALGGSDADGFVLMEDNHG